MSGRFELTQIGTVESTLTDRAFAPKQGDEGAPEAVIVFDPAVAEALDGIRPGDGVIVLTWLDRCRPRGAAGPSARRSCQADPGVFNTRSADRPNPIGLHPVEVISIDGLRMRVRDLEALDGTPVLDVKPVI